MRWKGSAAPEGKWLCPPKCHGSWFLEQETDDAVVLSIIHLPLQGHLHLPPFTHDLGGCPAVDHISELLILQHPVGFGQWGTGKKWTGRKLRLGNLFPWQKITAPVSWPSHTGCPPWDPITPSPAASHREAGKHLTDTGTKVWNHLLLLTNSPFITSP